MIQEIEGGHFRIDTEFLGEIAEETAGGVFVGDEVERIEMSAAGIGLEQGGENFHERGFACAIGAEQAEHAGRNFETHAAEGANAAGIGLREILN